MVPENEFESPSGDSSVVITGLMLRSHEHEAVVELEIGGRWYPIVACDMRSAFSHIVEPLGIRMRIAERRSC